MLPLRRSPRAAAATTSSAALKVHSSRGSSNSEPDRPSPGAAAIHSRRPLCVAGASARLETATDGAGAMAYIPGLAAEATATATDLSAGCRSSSREVRAQRPRAPARAC